VKIKAYISAMVNQRESEAGRERERQRERESEEEIYKAVR
jgi:hypothetical protein